MPPSADCSQVMKSICRVRLVAQSPAAVGDCGRMAAGRHEKVGYELETGQNGKTSAVNLTDAS